MLAGLREKRIAEEDPLSRGKSCRGLEDISACLLPGGRYDRSTTTD